MNKSLNKVEILSHSRHDWLNQIQLIDGYLSLGHTDKAKQVIQRVVAQSLNESELMKMKAPSFIEDVLTFNWYDHAFTLSFEAIVEQDWSSVDGLLSDCLRSLADILDAHSETGSEQDMAMMIQDGDQKQVTFHFQGKLQLHDTFLNDISAFTAKFSPYVEGWHHSEEECVFVLKPH
ncbi:Spo0B domain-containing protein [Salisediminibacterium beveridgei]|uniref:Sporulation initiation phosphotransferase B (Spo0B) n=1 Tax=Salisediminibacterium beveridgei TaxID=632773 RepID=A0A1D7QTY4_9BACI|nr:Spo0B C-terminal domain-containing protein [Salisediminibacterium beveridgei]AOM82471.1 Sporulation initiation phosphotransferase B (Spo0B) [Salisediminibacterium beveridgei]